MDEPIVLVRLTLSQKKLLVGILHHEIDWLNTFYDDHDSVERLLKLKNEVEKAHV